MIIGDFLVKMIAVDYSRALRGSQSIDAPWCQIRFHYSEPVTTDFTLVTYCVTRSAF